MAKQKETIPYEDFLAAVDEATLPMVEALDARMRAAGCEVHIEPAKSGYVVSYRLAGKVLANFVFRRQGLVLRLYADHILRYMELLEEWPPAMRAKVAKAPLCRRLVNPELCNPHCPQGYEFILDGENHQKCRYNCFLLPLGPETHEHLQALLERELACRSA